MALNLFILNVSLEPILLLQKQLRGPQLGQLVPLISRERAGADTKELQPLPAGQYPISATECISLLLLSWVLRGFDA